MDYIIFLALHNTNLQQILILYDIACQWWKKIWNRHTSLPPSIQLDKDQTKVMFTIPKFHIQGHKEECQTKYSLNLIPGVGHTDGEIVEVTWSRMNPAANSTKEMGEGSQHDALDDFCGNANYVKVITLSMLAHESC